MCGEIIVRSDDIDAKRGEYNLATYALMGRVFATMSLEFFHMPAATKANINMMLLFDKNLSPSAVASRAQEEARKLRDLYKDKAD